MIPVCFQGKKKDKTRARGKVPFVGSGRSFLLQLWQTENIQTRLVCSVSSLNVDSNYKPVCFAVGPCFVNLPLPHSDVALWGACGWFRSQKTNSVHATRHWATHKCLHTESHTAESSQWCESSWWRTLVPEASNWKITQTGGGLSPVAVEMFNQWKPSDLNLQQREESCIQTSRRKKKKKKNRYGKLKKHDKKNLKTVQLQIFPVFLKFLEFWQVVWISWSEGVFVFECKAFVEVEGSVRRSPSRARSRRTSEHRPGCTWAAGKQFIS